ncbi:MAG: HAMP domain-containing histidine kinase [Candidatus Heimdallarchaeota archaeon]|nr:MAG: HAMP domain-containing histidine kinase [Candidatus Heimdallarchaeota archaeon]
MTISDNGSGIEEKNLELIFNQFVTFPTSYRKAGTGIGLYLSRKIVEAHGGTIIAKSEGLGKGSNFIIEIPRLKE